MTAFIVHYFALYLSAVAIVSAVYVFQGNPYQPGPLGTSSFILEKGEGGIPKRTIGTYKLFLLCFRTAGFNAGCV